VAAILHRYNINEETYRKQFRGLTLNSGETPWELVTHFTDLANKWLKDCSSVDEVRDAIVKEQLLATIPDDMFRSGNPRQAQRWDSSPKTTCRHAGALRLRSN
jgi:hypothetical protein